jgi:hypothetical protein
MKRQWTRYTYMSSTTVFLYKGKGKGEVDPVNTVKAFRGRRIITLLSINLGARWGSVINITPCPI